MVARYKAVTTLLENAVNKLPISLTHIENIIKKNGWSIIGYNLNSENHIKLLKQYDVLSIAKRTKAFTYKHETENSSDPAYHLTINACC